MLVGDCCLNMWCCFVYIFLYICNGKWKKFKEVRFVDWLFYLLKMLLFIRYEYLWFDDLGVKVVIGWRDLCGF